MWLVLRLGAIVIVLLPLVISAALRDLAWAPWLGAGVALLLGLTVTLLRPRARSLTLMGTMLAVFAGLTAPQLEMPMGAPTVVDLRSDSLPSDLQGPAEITGFFRNEWVLAEYAVAHGDLPQQDDAAAAQLVPFVGVEDGPVSLSGAVLIVRVRPGQEEAAGVQTLTGRVRRLEDELLATFIQASGLAVPAGVHGLLLDTLVPVGGPAVWIRGALVFIALVAAFVCLWIATRPAPLALLDAKGPN